MAAFVLPLINGTTRSFDTDDITGVGAMSAEQLRIAGVKSGTVVTESAIEYEVAMELRDVLVAFYATEGNEDASEVGDSIEAALGTAGPFTLLAFTQPAAGGRITIPVGEGGIYLLLAKGDVRNSDVSDCYPNIGWMVDGVQVGGTSGMSGLGVGIDTMTQMSGAAIGPYISQFADGAVISLGVSVVPGGVAGDEITISNYKIIAVRLR